MAKTVIYASGNNIKTESLNIDSILLWVYPSIQVTYWERVPDIPS